MEIDTVFKTKYTKLNAEKWEAIKKEKPVMILIRSSHITGESGAPSLGKNDMLSSSYYY